MVLFETWHSYAGFKSEKPEIFRGDKNLAEYACTACTFFGTKIDLGPFIRCFDEQYLAIGGWMTIEYYPKTKITPNMVDEIAYYHKKYVPSFLSDFQLPIIRKFYDLLINDMGTIAVICLDENSRLVGCIVGSTHPHKIYERIREPIYWFAYHSLISMVYKPIILKQIISSLNDLNEIEYDPGDMEALYMFVLPEYRKSGMGTDLMEKLIEFSRLAGYKRMVASIEKDNHAVHALLKRLGYEKVDEFMAGNFERYRFVLNLE